MTLLKAHWTSMATTASCSDMTFIYQRDNDPKHTSRQRKGHLTKKESDGVLRQMTWCPQSPDLNPTSAQHLWELLQDCWKIISGDDLMKLIERMPRVCKAVIEAKGGYFEESKIKKHVLSYFTLFCLLHNSIHVHS